VTNQQPLAALEPAKPLTRAFALHSCGFERQRQRGWSSDTSERRQDGGGMGCGERAVCVEQRASAWDVRLAGVCVACGPGSDRAKVESSSASGAGY
jgi:hypothetical protein